MSPHWLSAFLDLPAETFPAAARFWCEVTGSTLSPSRGEHGEFATLVPATGDDYLRIQRLRSGPARIHLDLHVEDPRAAADRAVSLGAHEVADLGYVVLTSPGGLTFCLVAHPGSVRSTPVTWPGGHRSMVYQVCLDVPHPLHEVETGFWAGLLEAEPDVLRRRPEFSWLRPGRQLALDVLVQRLDRSEGPVGAHLDLGTSDRTPEVARHVALGAEVVAPEEFWTVLRDPAGLLYCITDRDPRTGRLG
jgi:hypothetical protein